MEWLFIFSLLIFIWSVSSEFVKQPLVAIGCFIQPHTDSNETHSLNILMDVGGKSAVSCVVACHKSEFRFAGIIGGKECRCGNSFRGQPSDNCTITCIPDSSYTCGGESTASVYETGGEVPGPPLQLRMLESTSSGLHISWKPPINDSSSPVLQFQVTATPLDSLSGLEPPGVRSWGFGSETESAWLYGVHPATHYTVEVRAANTAGVGAPAITEGWTSIAHPPIPIQPELLTQTLNTKTVKLHTVNPVNGPITSYQIVVVDETVGAVMNPTALTDFFNASKQELPYYIAGEFDSEDFITVFTVGDGKIYGGFFNAPLKKNVDYHILLGAVSHLNKTLTSYSPSDHGQHSSSVLSNADNPLSKHEFPSTMYAPDVHMTGHIVTDNHSANNKQHIRQEPSALLVGLSVSVGVLGCLVLIAVMVYIGLRIYLRTPRHMEHQELTVNSYDGGSGELPSDGLSHYLSEEDLPDHYNRLKQRIAVMAPAHLTIVGDVGQGIFGSVKKGVLRSSLQVHSSNHREGSVLVQHVLDSALLPGDRACMLRCLGQHAALGQHQHVVPLLGLVEEVAAVSLVFEYHTLTLKQYLTDARALTHYPVYAEKHRRFSTVSEQQVIHILCGVARGLQFLQSCSISHGMLCARNVLLQDASTPKITGFGLLHYTNDMHMPDYRRWMARELLGRGSSLRSAGYLQNGTLLSPCEEVVSSLQGDIWSFGVLLWEAVTIGATPYPELRGDEITARVQTGLRPPQPQYVGDELYQLMLDCWQLDPAERPEFPHLEGTLNQLAGEGSHLLFATYPAFQYHLYAPHLEFID